MAKKNISKTIINGSPKKRLLLLSDHLARVSYGLEGLITDSEFNSISDSFKSDKEINLWNEYRRYGATLNNVILNLQGLKYEVLMHYSNLRGYILMWNAIESAEEIANLILHETKAESRERALAHVEKITSIPFVKATIDSEDYLELNVDFEKMKYKEPKDRIKRDGEATKEFSLLYVTNNVKGQAEKAIARYKAWYTATIEFMEDKGFNVKTYRDKIEDMTREVYQPIIGWNKYNGGYGYVENNPHMVELYKKYNISPDVDSIEMDQEEYESFKTNML